MKTGILRAAALSLVCTGALADMFRPGNVAEAICIIREVCKEVPKDGVCDLSDMDFEEVSPEIMEALKKDSCVKKLFLSKNQLKAIPKGISELDGLVVLDLSHNEIERISLEDVRNMKGLEELILTNNKLKPFPWSVMRLRKLGVLKNLDLRSNPLPRLIRSRVGKLLLRFLYGDIVKVGDL